MRPGDVLDARPPEPLPSPLAPEPISAFAVSFHLRSRGDEPHDVDTRLRFLSPGYLRSEVRETGRGHPRSRGLRPESFRLPKDEQKTKIRGRVPLPR